MMQTPEEYYHQLTAILTRMDEAELREIFAKRGFHPSSDEVFWRAVHKARTALPSVSLKLRQESKKWLLAHGSEPWDDGDVNA